MTVATDVAAGLPSASAPRQRRLVRQVLCSPRGAITAGFIVLVIVVCVAAPLIAPHNPMAQHLTAIKQGPSGRFWLGTDSLGRDLLSRILYGGRGTLWGVFVAVAVYLAIAVPLGIVAGYVGGLTDTIIMRIVDLVMSIPVIIIVLAVLSLFGQSITVAMLMFGILGAAGLIRLVRGAALAAREELYVSAAHVIGLSRRETLTRHVLPQCYGVIIVQASLFAAIAIGVQTGLAFLGFGPAPPAPTWGGMVGEGASLFDQDPWLLVPPGVVIALVVLAFGVFGDTVRDVTAAQHSAAGEVRAPRRRRKAPLASVPPAQGAVTDALLSVHDLSVAFASRRGMTSVVQGVSFDIGRGEAVGLIGESGCGKSVTALALAGLLPGNGELTSGSVIFDGADITHLRGRARRQIRGRRIALISQDPSASLDPSFRVGAQVAEIVRAHSKLSRRAAWKRAVELLGMMEIPEPAQVARRYPHQISGGMAQRVAIAIALAGRPELLIADEPTTALDVTVQAEILDLLRSLQAETGMSILLVTHDWGVVADFCSRAVTMYAGQVVERATIEDLFRMPTHPYTRALLDSSPDGVRPGERIVAIPGQVPAAADWPQGCHFYDRCKFAQPDCREQPIPMTATGAGRESRCIHVDDLLARHVERAG